MFIVGIKKPPCGIMEAKEGAKETLDGTIFSVLFDI